MCGWPFDRYRPTAAPPGNLAVMNVAQISELQRTRTGLTAAAGPPLLPPRDWFETPEPEAPMPLTVTSDGQLYGHAALWGTCHTGKPGKCITPPRSRSGYRFFQTGLTDLEDGSTVATGRVTLGTGHASLTASPITAAEYYDNTVALVADVTVKDGRYGIWIAGAQRPSVSPQRLHELRGAALSGDWRNIRGSLEMLGLLAVNVPGFPVPRALSASGDNGEALAMVAAGALGHQHLHDFDTEPTSWEPPDEFDISPLTFDVQVEMIYRYVEMVCEGR